MAIGDDAAAAGFPLVPSTGDQGLVKYGAREINNTRDMVARTKALIPVSHTAYQTASGITIQTAIPDPATIAEGDIVFVLVP